MIDSQITDYVIGYFKEKTNRRKMITNQQLDLLLQQDLGCRAFSDGGIRALIHQIRVHNVIRNQEGEVGWICGTHDGYYLSYNAIDILTHLNQFEGKIRKMMVVHKKGMETLKNKIYYMQSTLKLDTNEPTN